MSEEVRSDLVRFGFASFAIAAVIGFAVWGSQSDGDTQILA